MNKELEQVLKAYNQVEEFISEMPLSYKGYNTLGASEYISERLNEIEEALNEYVELKQALTPPTAEEVCEALNEWFGKKVIYIADVKKFAYEGVDGWKEICYFGKNLKGDVIRFSFKLPPHLITLIGRFYKGESK